MTSTERAYEVATQEEVEAATTTWFEAGGEGFDGARECIELALSAAIPLIRKRIEAEYEQVEGWTWHKEAGLVLNSNFDPVYRKKEPTT